MRRMLLVLICLAPVSVSAQRLSGRVVQNDSVTAAAGALLEAELITDAQKNVRSLTTRSGSFTMLLPSPGTYRIRGLRIGYVPTDLGTITVRGNEEIRRQFVLGSRPVLLTSVRVNQPAQCGVRADGSQVAELLFQARTALRASTMTSLDGAVQSQMRRYRAIVDHADVVMAGPWDESQVNASLSPFTSVGVEALRDRGFITDDAGSLRFLAPDADVLLSEWFVSRYCFRVAENPARSDEIGVSFAPQSLRGNQSGIIGTLWMSREGAALRRVEFGYTNVPQHVENARAGGTIAFAELPDGSWIVREWELRMPRPSRLFGTSPAADAIVVVSSDRIGGEVLRVERAGELLLRREATSNSALFPSLADATLVPSCPERYAPTPLERGLIYGFVLTSDDTPSLDTRVRLTWPESRRGVARSQSDLYPVRAMDAPDGFFMACSLPINRPITVVAWKNDGRSTTQAVRLRNREPSRFVSLKLEASAPD